MLVAGNHTQTPEGFQSSLVPRNWGEDQLLPRQWDANGHARGILAPGGWIAQTDPDGKTWEIVSSGYRNSYDIAFNAEGELFAYDSDMEWDMGMPWYRPTRAVHATSGSEFGWRSGTGKWPAYYVDSLPPMVNIGPGSPVGVTFGYGAKFPAKYQKALYLCDWTFGTMYALHLEPQGSTYKAVKEEFLSRTPLPLTDAAVGPDGALVFHDRRPRDAVGAVPRDLRRQRIDRAGRPRRAPAGRSARLAAVDRTVPPQESDGAGDRREHLSVPRPRRPLHPLRGPGRARASTGEALARPRARRDEPGIAHHRGRRAGPPGRQVAPAAIDRGPRTAQLRLARRETQQLELLRAWSLVFIRMGAPDAPTAARLAKQARRRITRRRATRSTASCASCSCI